MFAIFTTGGKQYAVSEGDIIFIEKLDVEAESTVEFDKVLMIADGAESKTGTPIVEGAKITAKVVKNGKAPKIHVFKYNAKKNYRRRKGHRQPYTKVQIESIAF